MSSTQGQPQAAQGDADEAARVALAVRAGVDAVLSERAPAERDAFWRAVALLYARGLKYVAVAPETLQLTRRDGGKLDAVIGTD